MKNFSRSLGYGLKNFGVGSLVVSVIVIGGLVILAVVIISELGAGIRETWLRKEKS